MAHQLIYYFHQMYKKQSVIPDSMVLPHANGADVIFCGRFIHFTTELPGLETPVSEEVVYGGGRTSLKRKSSFRRKSRQNPSNGKYKLISSITFILLICIIMILFSNSFYIYSFVLLPKTLVDTS
jgi:hypothetical protein